MTTAYCAIIETKQTQNEKKTANQIKQPQTEKTNKPQNLQQQKIWKKKKYQLWS